jgi:hypothetical protein
MRVSMVAGDSYSDVTILDTFFTNLIATMPMKDGAVYINFMRANIITLTTFVRCSVSNESSSGRRLWSGIISHRSGDIVLCGVSKCMGRAGFAIIVRVFPIWMTSLRFRYFPWMQPVLLCGWRKGRYCLKIRGLRKCVPSFLQFFVRPRDRGRRRARPSWHRDFEHRIFSIRRLRLRIRLFFRIKRIPVAVLLWVLWWLGDFYPPDEVPHPLHGLCVSRCQCRSRDKRSMEHYTRSMLVQRRNTYAINIDGLCREFHGSCSWWNIVQCGYQRRSPGLPWILRQGHRRRALLNRKRHSRRGTWPLLSQKHHHRRQTWLLQSRVRQQHRSLIASWWWFGADQTIAESAGNPRNPCLGHSWNSKGTSAADSSRVAAWRLIGWIQLEIKENPLSSSAFLPHKSNLMFISIFPKCKWIMISEIKTINININNNLRNKIETFYNRRYPSKYIQKIRTKCARKSRSDQYTIGKSCQFKIFLMKTNKQSTAEKTRNNRRISGNRENYDLAIRSCKYLLFLIIKWLLTMYDKIIKQYMKKMWLYVLNHRK